MSGIVENLRRCTNQNGRGPGPAGPEQWNTRNGIGHTGRMEFKRAVKVAARSQRWRSSISFHPALGFGGGERGSQGVRGELSGVGRPGRWRTMGRSRTGWRACVFERADHRQEQIAGVLGSGFPRPSWPAQSPGGWCTGLRQWDVELRRGRVSTARMSAWMRRGVRVGRLPDVGRSRVDLVPAVGWQRHCRSPRRSVYRHPRKPRGRGMAEVRFRLRKMAAQLSARRG